MAIIKVDVHPDFYEMYRKVGYPLGKSRRGMKKWIKRMMLKALEAVVYESNK